MRAEKERRRLEGLRERYAERAVRHEVDGAFEAFVRLLWEEIEPDALEWAPFMSTVCHYLHRHVLGDPEYRKLLILLPPGTSKSILVSVMMPAFEWLFDPAYRRLFFTGNDGLSTRDSRRTRRAIKSDTYQQLMQEWCRRNGTKPWVFAADQQEKRNFETTEMGFRQCMTLLTGVTGKRGAGIAVDDPIDIKTVLHGSPEAVDRRCEEANEIIKQAMATRVNDPRVARRLLCMQRLHVNDPAGYALRDGDWKVLCLPLHYDPEHPQVSPDDPRTEPGEILHPTRHTPAVVEEMKAGTGRLAEAQLELRPTPASGGMIKREWFRERYYCEPEDIARTAEEVWISSDAAKKGTALADYNAIQCWARKDGKRYILDRVYAKMSSIDYFQAMDAMIAKWAPFIRVAPGGCLVEDTANGTNYLDAREPAYLGVSLIRFHPSSDTPGPDKSKGARARFYERAAESGACILPAPEVASWISDYIESIVAFPLGANDDDMDASSQLHMRWTLEDQGQGSGGSWFDMLGR
jgi:phage terminase large subunit-like protein